MIMPLGHYLSGQTANVVVPIEDIWTSGWSTLFCPEDPDVDWNNRYDGEFLDKDVNKLRTFPYTNNSSSGNPFIDNHTFWFSFGCCGRSFCVDDGSSSNVHTDDFWNVGSLYMPNVWIGHPTSIWINFLTQCENCSGAGEAGSGVWHKWEEWYDPGELWSANGYPGYLGAAPSHQMSVPCDAFSSYGCQSGELR